nr:aryl-sulfate sulfotransferase [Deltaproteobacteria bacterium]
MTSWILWLAACSGDGGNDSPTVGAPVFSDGPTIEVGGPLVPLSNTLHVTLSEPARLDLSATDGEETVEWVSPTATVHAVPLVGLHADGAWSLSVHAVDADGETADAAVTLTTGSLPSPLPNLDLVVSDPARMQPGLTLIPLFAGPATGYLALLDENARVVWIYGPSAYKFTEVRPYAGHLLALDNTRISEIDWMGNFLRSWTSGTAEEQEIPVAVEHFHHELLVSSRETFVTWTKEPVFIENFPTSEYEPQPQADSQVANDTVLEIDIATGELVGTWPMEGLFDPQRLGFESLSVDETGFEWTHTNSIFEDAVNGRWVVSARNQDAVMAFDKTTNEIAWILGNHDNWHAPWTDSLLTPEGAPFEWPYHQHAAKYDPATGRLLLFDNGNYRSSPWTGVLPEESDESYSRLVQYTIDEGARTVRQDWEYRMSPDVFSRAMGDADWLPNGNILGNFALVGWQDGRLMADFGRGDTTVRVVEIDPDTGDVVWYLDAWRSAVEGQSAWQA